MCWCAVKKLLTHSLNCFGLFSTYGYNVKWSNLDPLDVIQLLGNFGRDGHRVQKEFESLLKRVGFCRVSATYWIPLYYYYYYNRFMAVWILTGLPGWAGTRRNIHPLIPIVVIYYPLSASSIYYDHGILPDQFTCLTVFLHNLCPSFLWSTSWPGALHFILQTNAGETMIIHNNA